MRTRIFPTRCAASGLGALGRTASYGRPWPSRAWHSYVWRRPRCHPILCLCPMPTPTRPRAGGSSPARSAASTAQPLHPQGLCLPGSCAFYHLRSLMGRSWDEPFTLYGCWPNRSNRPEPFEWVEFTLRPEARFSDGSPVTVEDVIWSYETLGTEGHPRYRGAWDPRSRVDRGRPGPRSVRLHLCRARPRTGADHRAAPDPAKGAMGGPRFRRIGARRDPDRLRALRHRRLRAGRFVELRRDPDYWGADLPF
jgi:peptide/nickel transport system substrate-binding protein